MQPGAQSGILIQTQPKRRRKGRKSMNRRKGQNGGRRHPVRLVSGPLAGGYRKVKKNGSTCLRRGHKPRTMSELYSHLFEEVELRLAESAQVGVGFDIPAYIAPLLQRICAVRRSGQYVSGCEIMELPKDGRLAQLVRAPALQAGGRRFESCTAHQIAALHSSR